MRWVGAWIAAVGIAACGGPKPARTPQPVACAEVAADLDAAMGLRAEGFLGRALIALRAVDAACSSPRSAEALAATRAELGVDDAGRARLTAATSDDDRRRAVLLYRDAASRRARGDHAEAIAQLQRAFALWPHPLTLVQLGLAERGAGRETEARRLFARALAMAELVAGASVVPHVATGHAGFINMGQVVAFGPRGRLVATGGTDEQVILWDSSSGRPLRSVFGHRFWVGAVAFSPAGDVLASGDGDGRVRLIDVDNGRVRAEVRVASKSVKSLAFSPDGATLYAAAMDGHLHWIDVDGASIARTVDTPDDELVAMALSTDGERVAVAGTAGAVSVFDTTSGARVAHRAIHQGTVWSLAYHPTDGWLASGGEDRRVRGWRGPELAEMGVLAEHASAVSAIAFTPDGREMVTSGGDSTVWRAATGGPPLRTIPVHLFDLALSPTGDRCAGAGIDGSGIWDTATREQVHALVSPWSALRSLAVQPGASTLFAADVEGRVVRWPLSQGDRPEVITRGKVAHDLAVDSGGRLAVADPDGVRLFDATGTSSPLTTLDATALAFDNAGRLLVGAEDRLQLWDGSGAMVYEQPRDARVVAIAVDPSADRIAIGSGGALVLAESPPYVELERVQGHFAEIAALAYAADGRTLVSGSNDFRAKAWRHDRTTTLRGHAADVKAVAVSADGALVATGSSDTTIKLWGPDGAEPLATLRGHPGWLVDLAFLDSDRLLVSAASDGTMRVWDVATRAPRAILAMDRAGHWLVAATDGRVDGSEDVVANVYWEAGEFQLPGFVGWQRQHTPGLLRILTQ